MRGSSLAPPTTSTCYLLKPPVARTTTEGNTHRIAWVKTSDERVAGPDKMDCWVLLLNGLSAAGNQVASSMNSLGAFSASSQLPFVSLALFL